jgi:hypothetical protein
VLANFFDYGTGALARTATSIKAGAQTPLAGYFKGVLKLLMAYFLASQLERVPLAGIAGILLWVATNMIKKEEIKEVLAESRFHSALHISYPNADDLALARRAGIAPGGDVMIHGLPDGERWVGDVHREYDWTNGCIGVTDDEMNEIWELVDDGTPIEIRP